VGGGCRSRRGSGVPGGARRFRCAASKGVLASMIKTVAALGCRGLSPAEIRQFRVSSRADHNPTQIHAQQAYWPSPALRLPAGSRPEYPDRVVRASLTTLKTCGETRAFQADLRAGGVSRDSLQTGRFIFSSAAISRQLGGICQARNSFHPTGFLSNLRQLRALLTQRLCALGFSVPTPTKNPEGSSKLALSTSQSRRSMFVIVVKITPKWSRSAPQGL